MTAIIFGLAHSTKKLFDIKKFHLDLQRIQKNETVIQSLVSLSPILQLANSLPVLLILRLYKKNARAAYDCKSHYLWLKSYICDIL